MRHTPILIIIRLVLAFCVAGLSAGSAGALQLSSSVVIDYSQQRITVIAKNTGQKTIRDLRVQLVYINAARSLTPSDDLPGYLDSRMNSLVRPALSVGETNRVHFGFDYLPDGAASILTRFHDADGRPFSSMSGCVLASQSDAVSLETCVKAAVQPVDLDLSGNLTIRLVNTGPSMTVNAGIYLPLEFTPATGSKTIWLAENKETTLLFHITNNYALAGGQYPVHCIVSDPNGVYSPMIVRTQLKIVPARTLIDRYRGAVIIAVFLLAGWLFYDHVRSNKVFYG